MNNYEGRLCTFCEQIEKIKLKLDELQKQLNPITASIENLVKFGAIQGVERLEHESVESYRKSVCTYYI